MRSVRKLAVTFLLLGVIPLLTGCWDRTEVNDLALIMSAGLDVGKNGTVELSVQVFTPNQSSDGSMDTTSSHPGSNKIIVQSASGTDFADAAAKLQTQLPRKVFWGHTEVFIFGEQLAKKGILSQIDFLFRHPQPREHAYIFVSKGKAKDILNINTRIERDIAETLREMVVLSSGRGVSLKDMNEMLIGRSKAAIIPLIERKEEPGGNIFPYISGAAVFKDGKMTGQFQDRIKTEAQLIRNELKTTYVTFPVEDLKGKEDGVMSVRIIKCHTKLIPVVHGNQWSVIVRIVGEASIQQNESHVNVMKPEELPRLETELNQEIKKRMEAAYRLIQMKTKADVFGVADAIWRKYPKQWLQAQSSWDEIFPNVNISAESNVKILWPGFSGKSFK